MGSLRPSSLPYVNEFVKLSELPSSTTPYSIASSALVNGLWSLICSFFIIIIFCLFWKWERGIYGWFLEQPLLNARTCGTSRLALFLNEGVALSPMHFSSYIYLTSSFISLISSLLILRERARHFENFAFVILLISSTLLPSSCWGRHSPRNRLLTP